MESQKTQNLYAPEWQFQSLMTWANELYVVAPRGTGKTERIQAVRALDCVKAMPRGKGAMIAVSYKKLKTHLLPPLVTSWDMLGWKRGVDYWIGNEKRPHGWKIPTPYIFPEEDRENFIHFSNGHGIHLLSQDRPGMSNGLSVEWMGADETRLMNKERYDDDASAILRGHPTLFEHLPQYGAITMTTDMPIDEDGQWILEMYHQMDSDRVDGIYELCLNLEMMIQAAEADPDNVSDQELADINTLQRMIDDLRRETVQFVEVADGSNLIFLGKKFIITQMRTMERTRFNASILGLRVRNLATLFYPEFNVKKHGYFDSDHTYLAKPDFVNDCRTDADIKSSIPMYLAFDHNASINCGGTGQLDGNIFRTLKSMYVLGRDGKKLKHLLDEFNEYYFFLPNRELVYIYDHTSIAQTAAEEETFRDIIVASLRAARWNVTEFYIGVAMPHDLKHRLIRDIEAEDGTSKFKSHINRDNNEQLIKVIETTHGIVTADKWQKDKKKEKQVKTFPQEDAPHLSDMRDLLVLGGLKHATTDHSWMIT